MARQGTRNAAHAKRIWENYKLTEDQYWYMWRMQGGVCYICARARGTTKRLSVDHDHACCPTVPTCGECTRGLLCSKCNRDVLGHLRDEPEAFLRGHDYLINPPFKRFLSGF